MNFNYGRNKLWIEQTLIDMIIGDIDKHYPCETGGVLMGYIGLNGDVVVTELIEAGPNAIHKRYTFTPDQEYQLKKIAEIFYKNNGNVNYLGDWHSHPKSTPDLSFIDKRTLTKIALTDKSNCPNPVMLIFGSKPEKWTMNAVRFISGKKVIWPFTNCIYETMQVEVEE